MHSKKLMKLLLTVNYVVILRQHEAMFTEREKMRKRSFSLIGTD